ncbi:MAG TPA: thiamine-phosphate kinase [Actinomycetota bacterium]|nr:thiamine-phosphate kinase [Actinomycetota bacterium]
MPDSLDTSGDRTVSELEEDGLVARLIERIGPPATNETWSGDDAAVLNPRAGKLLATVDGLIEGVDYDLRYMSAADVGWKAVMTSASDCAAMGGRPAHCLATVGLRHDTPLSFYDGVLDGMLEAAGALGMALVGGDITRARETSLTVSVLGYAQTPVYRSGASEGDTLCVTGSLGAAAAGLRALQGHIEIPARLEEAAARLKSRQIRPRARIEEGVALAERGATAMIDVSDGLGIDLGRLLRASGYGCEVDTARVPISEDVIAVAEQAAGLNPLELALAGGEDYELLAAVPEAFVDDARRALRELGCSLTSIGTVTVGEPRLGADPLEKWEKAGWDHLRHV